MRKTFRAWWVLAAVAGFGLVVFGCGGGEPTVHPTPVASLITPVVPTPNVPSLYTGSADRLVLPTLTPSAESSDVVEQLGVDDVSDSRFNEIEVSDVDEDIVGRPTPSLRFDPVTGGSGVGTPTAGGLDDTTVMDVSLTEDEIDKSLALRPTSCVEEFRRLLINYDGAEAFGPEVATRLSEQLLLDRSDCADSGWSPEFALGAVCQRIRISDSPDSEVPITFSVRLGNDTVLVPSRRETVYGKILLHFDKLPFRDEGGCWYYRADIRKWFWNVRMVKPGFSGDRPSDYYDAESGVDLPKFHACDAMLQRLLPKLIAKGDELDAFLVAYGIDRVRLQVYEHCAGVDPYGRYVWGLYPQNAAQAACPVQEPTGPTVDGGYVVHWVDGHFDAEDRPCWVLQPVDGTDNDASGNGG